MQFKLAQICETLCSNYIYSYILRELFVAILWRNLWMLPTFIQFKVNKFIAQESWLWVMFNFNVSPKKYGILWIIFFAYSQICLINSLLFGCLVIWWNLFSRSIAMFLIFAYFKRQKTTFPVLHCYSFIELNQSVAVYKFSWEIKKNL